MVSNSCVQDNHSCIIYDLQTIKKTSRRVSAMSEKYMKTWIIYNILIIDLIKNFLYLFLMVNRNTDKWCVINFCFLNSSRSAGSF